MPVSSPAAPHVLLFICDQMQYQRQGHVDPVARTPHLDRFADEAVFYTHVHSSNGQCVPSRVSMQTGLYPHEAGVMIIYGFHGHTAHLTGDQRTVGHVFRDAGYTTAYFGKTHFGTSLASLGYDFGSEGGRAAAVDEEEGPHGAAADRARRRNSVIDRAIVDGALDFLAGYDPAKPLFLTVSVHSPHPPFEVVPQFAGQYPVDQMPIPASFYEDDLTGKPDYQREHALDGRHGFPDTSQSPRLQEEIHRYYTMISLVDAFFGEVRAAFEAKGMWSQTAALFTADHGDMMGAHRMRLKGTIPYDEIFRIPFVLKLPEDVRQPARTVVDDLACNVAQPGTLIEAAGLPVPADFRGGSLLPAAYAAQRPARERVFFEHYGAYWGLHPFRAIRTRDAAGEWKLATYYGPDAGEAELYDLASDPHEIHNLANDPAASSIRETLSEQVETWWRRTGGRDFAYYESPTFKLSGAATLVDRRANGRARTHAEAAANPD